MRPLRWMPGPAEAARATFISATRFTYRSLSTMPIVFWHGLRLRRAWGGVDGAIGVYEGSDLRRRTTYTMTAWRGPEDLRRWLGGADHAGLMRRFRPHLESCSVVSWSVDVLDRRAAWQEALRRLAEDTARRGA